ncbi:FadR family transcriptional regulator [Robertmurraya yapensis]|uniref:FadR family transcriptional regulator n=1 Tax=Bacillus yapensis TaxID=2492960 RepID=A0A3S0IIE8_9BACI|nr:FadR/GntR family transcriptional regulator [Bacillus yapensis]RTR36009.1 FadR family transcriptional regulator [Bacillus yapensis]TKT05512.1 FCD domain-containing protein [Bacillus yapensis]
MNVEKISVKKVSESVVEQIEKMIEHGSFQSGEKLPSVREMCEMFGVGRSAIRDAIITLKGKGTVDIRQGEGTYVCRFDSSKIFNNHLIIPESSDVRALFQVRKILEPGIAEMAASNRTDEQLAEIEAILSNKTTNGWEEDYNFHMTIAKASRNQIIYQLIQFISTTTKKHMNDFHQFIQEDPKLVEKINEQHKEIFLALKETTPELAKNKMTEHLEYVETILQKSLWKPTSQKREEPF